MTTEVTISNTGHYNIALIEKQGEQLISKILKPKECDKVTIWKGKTLTIEELNV